MPLIFEKNQTKEVFMKKIYAFIFLLAFTSLSFGLKVNTKELQTAKQEGNFVNYQGPAQKKDSSFAVQYIGTRLSRVSKNNEVFPYYKKYSVIRAISEEEPEKFNADIFIIENNAKVNHIKDLRLILTGFFKGRYGYSQKDAQTLALWTTYYNAVYRKDLEYFSSVYKKNVMQFISSNNAGLDLHYKEWVGKTRMLIPLTKEEQESNLNALSTSILSDGKVIESVRQAPDKGIEEREELVDLKERQVEEKKEEVAKKEEEVKEEKEEIKKAEEEIITQEVEIKKAEEEIKKQEEEIEKITEPEKKEEAIKELEEKKQALEEEKQAVEEKKEEIEEKKEEVAKKEEVIQEEKKEIKEKTEEIAKDKLEIQEDKKELAQQEAQGASLEAKKEVLEKKEQELVQKEKELEKREELIINKEEKDIFSGKLYYLKNIEYTVGGHYYNKLLMIDAASRQVEKESPLKTISGRKFDIFADGIVVISHAEKDKEYHNLVVLDRATLAPTLFGRDNIFWRSFIEIRGDFIYAIVKENNAYYLGKFDSKMAKVAQSKEPIHENSFISFYGSWIYVNGANKQILVLKNNDLSLNETIKP